METKQTAEFIRWIKGLKNDAAKRKIRVRIARLEAGLFGDVKSVGDGVSELRIDSGPGYRLYFTRRGNQLVILLIGGDKGSQKKDIEAAKKLANLI